MAFRLNFQVSIAYAPDGSTGMANPYGGNNSCSPVLGVAKLDFFTPTTGIAIAGGNTPTAQNLLDAFNAMVVSLQAQTAPLPVLNRIQNFAVGGS